MIRILFIALCCSFMPLKSKEVLKRLAIFSTPNELPPENVLMFFDSILKKEESINITDVRSPFHYMLYEIPKVGSKENRIIEVPDFQINYLYIYLVQNDQIRREPILKYGDEMSISEWTHPTRTCQAILELNPNDTYKLLVRYQRPGNRPQLQINLHDPNTFLCYWNNIEYKYGFIYGLIFTYTILTLLLFLYSREKSYFYFSIWIFIYWLYNFITTGHLKYYFNIDVEGQYSNIRVTLAFLGAYAMNAFSLIHYNREKEFWFVRWFWNLFLCLAIVLNGYNLIFNTNVYEGYEIEFIIMLRSLTLLLVFTQVYLPIAHYRKYKEITYLTYIWIFSGATFLFYLYQTINLDELDFNEYIFYTVWLLIFEIFIIALGIGIFTVKQKRRRIDMYQKKNELQRNARILQFEVRENERKRIASELHDDVLNRLSVSLLLFRDKYMTKQKFKENLLEIAQDITQYTYGIYPLLSDTTSIESLIDKNILPLIKAKGIALELNKSDLKTDLNQLTLLHIYRLIQEFVKNAIMHGHATRVLVKITEVEGMLKLYLNDNGIGFDVDNTLPGLGTESAKNRIEVLGGELNIRSKEGEGVDWDLVLPLT